RSRPPSTPRSPTTPRRRTQRARRHSRRASCAAAGAPPSPDRFIQETNMPKQRISYVPFEKMDAAMQEEMRRCEREGTPRPESTAVRAHVPAAFWFFANSWRDLFHTGVLDHAIKE